MSRSHTAPYVGEDTNQLKILQCHSRKGRLTSYSNARTYLVPLEGAETFAVVRAPYGRNVIFAGGEKQIAVVIVQDGRYGTFVSLEQEGALCGGNARRESFVG